MSIRERIMAVGNPYVGGHGQDLFEHGKKKCADLAEARERELLATLTESSKHEAMLENRVMQLLAQRDELLAALKDLLSDTQHKEHECADALCPVKVARAAIAKVEGENK